VQSKTIASFYAAFQDHRDLAAMRTRVLSSLRSYR
jgi:hypothetical protein